MPREIVKYGTNGHGAFHEFGNVRGGRDRPEMRERLFTMLDQLNDFYGREIFHKEIEQDSEGRFTVTVKFDGEEWYKREERADRLERMLQWLVLKMSVEELRYLGVLPKGVKPESFSVEQLIAGLDEQFEAFRKADDRLRESIGRKPRMP
jgi:hypothetical protein